VKVFWARFSTI